VISTGVSTVLGNGRLWWERAGRGPNVTLLHPGLWDSRTWDPQFDPWSERFQVLRYDLRGYGRSSRLDGGRYSHVQDLVDLLDHLEIETTALVGCSMGGAIALDATLAHPDRVSALVLAAPGLGGFDENEAERSWWEERGRPIEAALEAGDIETAETLRLGIWAPLGTDDDAGRRISDIAFDNIHEITMDESGEEGLDPPAARRLGEVAVPTLVMIAEHDPPDMIRIGETLIDGIPGAAGHVVADADHVVNLRQPQRFDEAALPFLTEHAR
jgi:pimeloyl-ACP methyl ester carboxylesterase